MLKVLNNNTDATVHELLYEMNNAVDEFVGDADQFDDLTMLAFYYKGPQNNQ